MSRLLVTGGLGFIGAQVVRQSVAAGHSVRVLDRTAGTVPLGVELMRDDLRRPGVADSALRGVDVVLHLAAKVGLGVDFDDAPDYTDVNVTGTAMLLAAMARSGVQRLVLSSSMVVYGEGAYRGAGGPVATPPRAVADLEAGRFDPLDGDGAPLLPEFVDETAEPDPRNVYAVSKLAQEQLASAWARAVDGRVAALRYHNVYGPGMPRDTPYAGVAALFRSELAHGRPPRVFEDGRQRRDFVHVRDVAAANLAALDWTSGDAHGLRAFNVGSGTVRTVGEIAAALAEAVGGPRPVVTGEYRLGDVRHITASSERARRELGWSAAVPFSEGMREFASESSA
jgi:dTDP-L-rhamnose 4-epimerase